MTRTTNKTDVHLKRARLLGTLFLVCAFTQCQTEISSRKLRASFPQRLQTLFFATNANPKLCKLLESTLASDHNITIIGWGGVDSRRFSKSFANYTCQLDSDEIVLSTDAFDAIFTANATPKRILNEYLKIGYDFVWSAESNMFPPFEELPKWVRQDYPHYNGNYGYLNFGAWIGRAGAACQFFSIAGQALDGHSIAPRMTCGYLPHDQAAAHCVFAALRSEKIRSRYAFELDSRNKIFHSAWPTCKDILQVGAGYFLVRSTGSCPAVLHFNGDAKKCSEPYYSSWYERTKVGPHSNINIFYTERNSSQQKLETFCTRNLTS